MKNRIINSTTFLLAAYFIVHFTNLGSQYIILKLLSVRDVVMYFFYNSYSIPADTWWTRLKVFLIFGIGVFMVFLLLILVIILLLKLSRKNFKLVVFYNWLIIVCSAFIISSVFSAPFFRESAPMYIVFLWMRFQPGGGGMYFLAILFLPLIPFVAYFIKNPFIKMTNSTMWIKTRSSRLKFFAYTAFIPFFILTIILYIFVYNLYSYPILSAASNEGMRLLVIGAILFFGGLSSFNKNYISIQKSNTTHLLNMPLTILVLVVVLAIYIVLWLNLS